MSTWLHEPIQGAFPVPTHFYDEARPRLGAITTDTCLWAFRHTLGIGRYGITYNLDQLASEIGHIPVDVADALDEAQSEGVIYLPANTAAPLLVVAYSRGCELVAAHKNRAISDDELMRRALAVTTEITARHGGGRA